MHRPSRRTVLRASLALPAAATIEGGRRMDLAQLLDDIHDARGAWYRGVNDGARWVRATAETIRQTAAPRYWPFGMLDDVAAIYHAASVVELHAGDQSGAARWAQEIVRLGRERIRLDIHALGVIALGDAFPDDPSTRLLYLRQARPVTPVMRALHAAHQAAAYAFAGDVSASLNALDVMDAALADAGGWPNPWRYEVALPTFGPACRGATSLVLGRLDDAERAFGQLDVFAANRIELAEARLHRARVLARRGEHEESVRLAAEAAAALLKVSPRNRPYAQEVRAVAAAAGAPTAALDAVLTT